MNTNVNIWEAFWQQFPVSKIAIAVFTRLSMISPAMSSWTGSHYQAWHSILVLRSNTEDIIYPPADPPASLPAGTSFLPNQHGSTQGPALGRNHWCLLCLQRRHFPFCKYESRLPRWEYPGWFEIYLSTFCKQMACCPAAGPCHVAKVHNQRLQK